MLASPSFVRQVQRLDDARHFAGEMELRRQWRLSIESEKRRRLLRHASGIEDETLLDRLQRLDFDAANWPALSLAPLPAIAWASGEVTLAERRAGAACLFGSDLAGHVQAIGLYHDWFAIRPDADLLPLWADCTRPRVSRMSKIVRQETGDRMLRQAEEIALASGGFLGLGAVCGGEREILDLIASVFDVE